MLDIYEHKKDPIPEDVFDQVQNQVMLRVINTRWMSHLSEMDYLRAGIGLRAVGQRDPLVEYKEEAYSAFQRPCCGHHEDFIRTVLRLQVNVNLEQRAARGPGRRSTAFRIRRPTRTFPMRRARSPAT